MKKLMKNDKEMFKKQHTAIVGKLKEHAFLPSKFLTNAHLQIAASLLTPYFTIPKPSMVRKLISLPDDSQVAADCWFQKNKEQCSTVIIVHGFEGYDDGQSRFGQSMGFKAYHEGFNVIFLRQRGEADTIHLTKSLGDFLAEDLPIALTVLSTWSKQKMYIVSLSLGAWATLLTIGRAKRIPPLLAGVVAISPPTNTDDTWRHIEKSKIYDGLLLKKYKSLVKRRIAIDSPGTWDIQKLQTIKTKKQFFETYKHTFGYPEKFSTLDEYFKSTDVLQYSRNIQIPTLIIHAFDDPVVPADPFTRPAITENQNIITMLSKHGSHGSFVAQKTLYGDLDRYWAQNRAMEFIELLAIDDSFRNKV
jgi:predicted alpha/beta-fold hydrolase